MADIQQYQSSECSRCCNNNGLSCPANGKGGVRVMCSVCGNVTPKTSCSQSNT